MLTSSKDDKSLNPLAKKHLHCARMLLRSASHANGFYGRSVSAKGLIEGDSNLTTVELGLESCPNRFSALMQTCRIDRRYPVLALIQCFG